MTLLHNDESFIRSLEYYATVYPHYEKQNPACKYDHYLDTLQQFHPDIQSMLDYGCASGRFLGFVNKIVPDTNLYGLDINESAIQNAQSNVPQGVFKAGEIDTLKDFPPVDVITALDVLEHVSSPEAVLLALKEKLNPNGILMAVVPVYDGPLDWLVHLLDKDPTHIQKCSRTFWISLLSQHFKILKWQGIFRILLPNHYYIHMPTHVCRYFTSAILIVGQSPASVQH